MKHSRLTSAICASFLLAFSSYAAYCQSLHEIHTNGFQEGVNGGNDDLAISEDLIADLELKALRGSDTAAWKLYQYFFDYKNNHNEGMFWLQIAAENGNQMAQKTLGIILSNSSESAADTEQHCYWTAARNRERAYFWLDRAKTANLH